MFQRVLLFCWLNLSKCLNPLHELFGGHREAVAGEDNAACWSNVLNWPDEIKTVLLLSFLFLCLCLVSGNVGRVWCTSLSYAKRDESLMWLTWSPEGKRSWSKCCRSPEPKPAWVWRWVASVGLKNKRNVFNGNNERGNLHKSILNSINLRNQIDEMSRSLEAVPFSTTRWC